LCIKMLPSTDLPTKKNTVIWVIKGLQELRQAADPNTAQEARLLALVAEYFEALVLTEDRREPEAWISKLKLLGSTLKDYCSHFLGGDCDGLRLTLCLEARNVARDYLGKNDRITSGNIVDWSKKVLDELRISKNEAVSINAIDILAAAEQLPKIKP
ncbi:MAG: hypothetical protein NT013_04045, partial [Planctomycetia bacterium]|nr:hypothetical protein [Planctomycetia bacterium]